jgi:hypothetical protein
MKARHGSCALALVALLIPTLHASDAAIGKEEKDWKDVPLTTLGVRPVAPTKEASGFIVGGKNATALIRKLTEINGRAIADLERDMRPGAIWNVKGKPFYEGSSRGFLGKEEKLLEVLAADNAYVVDEQGLTHQDLARALHAVAAVANEKDVTDFVYNGRRFKVALIRYKGSQYSPFFDDTSASIDATVTNATSGKEMRYSLLVPHMIERYGFYEGHGTPYRVEPRRVLEVFDFLKKR